MTVWLQALLHMAPGAGCSEFGAWLDHHGRAAVARAGGGVWGLWDGRPGLGFGSDEALLVTTWPDDAAAGAAVEMLKACPHVVGIEGTPLHATVRPADDTPASGKGIYVFREFFVPDGKVERFIDLSAEAWTSFERNFAAEIKGLFRGPNLSADLAILLLVTRYEDLATWEASRSETKDPDAWQRFRERQALTSWTRARSAALVDL